MKNNLRLSGAGVLSIGYRGFRHLDTLLNGSNDFDETLMEWVPGVIYLVGWVATTGKPRGEKHRGKLFSHIKGSMPPSIGHMELLVWMQRADFSEHIQGCKSPGDPLNSSHFDAPNTKSAPTGYRRAPNIISHHYKQQLSAKASIVPKARPIRFR